MTVLPKVAVLVLDAGPGPEARECRASLLAQRYPADRVHIDVLDAGPRGPAMSFNAAVVRADADFVALVSGSVRADPQWLAELVSTAERHDASAVGARIMDWSGHAEVAGERLSMIGEPLPSGSLTSADRRGERRVLFASGESALFKRAALHEAGGFDDAYFTGLEDVDLGWRLNVMGHTVVSSPDAVAYRWASGTQSRWAAIRRRRLLERNALATIYKNYETATLERVLPVALALSLLRGLSGSGLDALSWNLSSRAPEAVDAAPELIAHLIALEDFSRWLPTLKRKREVIQRKRRRRDAELWGLFPGWPELLEGAGQHGEIIRALIRDFGIDDLVSRSLSRPGRLPTRRPEPEIKASFEARPLPPVSIVILTALGSTHLAKCLASLRSQTYPSGLIEVIVVDNASEHDPTADVQRAYPGARVIRTASNIGFAAGNNLGAAAAAGDYVVFLNDDTRVAPNWLVELVEVARRRGATAVASGILDWSGERIDFIDAAVSFQGKGFQLEYDAPLASIKAVEKPLLFACGCALLIERRLFAEAGGWDEGTFAYYEDVELGWRLNLLGCTVWLAPQAVVYHKHHGTSGQWPEPPRIRLYERNSLRIVYQVFEPDSLGRALSASLLLAADRALLGTTLSRATDILDEASEPRRRLTGRELVRATKSALVSRGINRRTPVGRALARLGARGLVDVATEVLFPRPVTRASRRRAAYLVERGALPADLDDGQLERLPIEVAAALSGIYGFLVDLPALSGRRDRLQRQRRVTDREIVSRFGSHWRQQLPARHQREHDELHNLLIDEFDIEAIGRREEGTDDASTGTRAPRREKASARN